MSPQEKSQWALVYQGVRCANEAAAADSPSPPSEEPFGPLWGVVTPTPAERWCPTPAAEVATENTMMAGELRLPLGVESAELRVVAPIEPINSGRPFSEATFGCYANKKNMCRETLVVAGAKRSTPSS